MADNNLLESIKWENLRNKNPKTKEAISLLTGFIPGAGDVQSGLLAAQDVKQGNYGSAALNSLGLLPFIPAMGGTIVKQIDPRIWMPNPRGGWTDEKIIKALKSFNYKNTKSNLPQRFISEYDNPEQLANNLYWHGTGGYLEAGLKPSIAVAPSKVEQLGGGGYGQQYWAASVSKDKNLASNFTGQSRSGSVYPVLINKNANIINMPELSDSVELENIASKLWNEKVDAVKLGDWSSPHSEKELAILNPRAAYVINDPTIFEVFGKQKFENPSQQQIENIYNLSKEQIKELDAIRSLPTKEERDLATQKLYFRGLLSD